MDNLLFVFQQCGRRQFKVNFEPHFFIWKTQPMTLTFCTLNKKCLKLLLLLLLFIYLFFLVMSVCFKLGSFCKNYVHNFEIDPMADFSLFHQIGLETLKFHNWNCHDGHVYWGYWWRHFPLFHVFFFFVQTVCVKKASALPCNILYQSIFRYKFVYLLQLCCLSLWPSQDKVNVKITAMKSWFSKRRI